MNIDLIGRIKNVTLSYSKPLMPLFEAVINAFDAIEDAQKGRNGRITISILRETTQTRLDVGGNPDIIGFSIEDNGIGFTEVNFNSFLTSDTEHKYEKGGKGVGRFLWLKAFESVNISSTFFDDSKWLTRNFTFKLNENGVDGGIASETKADGSSTIVKLLQFKENYSKNCPKKADTIAYRLVEHCVSRFIDDNCPSVFLVDGNESTSLNQLFTSNYKKTAETRVVEVSDMKFGLLGLKLTSTEELHHRVHLCANGREVTSYNLIPRIKNLTSRLVDENGNVFHFVCYLSGQYLDDNVNQERTAFAFPEEKSNDIVHAVSLEDILSASCNVISEILQPYLEPIREKKKLKIEHHLQSEAPQFRHLAKYMADELDEIPPDVTNDKLDIELFRINQKHELKLRQQTTEFLEESNSITDSDDYSEKFSQFMEEISESGKATLAKYIIHRRLVLNLLENSLKKRSDNKYPLEERVHEIIFPLRADSSEVPYDKQNLWLIDEKLSYHYYLASDLQFDKIEPVQVNNKKRPDLLVFNQPIAFVDQEPPFTSVVVIEFKRPMRKDYDDSEENPIAQVWGYIRDIQEGNKLDRDGRPINPQKGLPYYAYIVADLTKRLRVIAEDYGLIATPDNEGYFGYNKNLEAYVELISYDKLLRDSQQRNRVLFEKLNLPVYSKTKEASLASNT